MPIIKSISSLRNRTREIATICHDQDEPVYLTTNGEGDLVVMSIDHYERLKAQVELFEKLGVAQAQSAAGKKGITHRQMMTKLRRPSQCPLSTGYAIFPLRKTTSFRSSTTLHKTARIELCRLSKSSIDGLDFLSNSHSWVAFHVIQNFESTATEF